MKESVGKVEGEVVYYMQGVGEMLRWQLQLALGPKNVMGRSEDKCAIDRAWKMHEMSRIYMWLLYSAMPGAVVQNVIGDLS